VEGAKYFSVKYAVKMFGIRFVPVVCYKLDATIEPTIRSMADAGDAKLYAEKVRFINGVAVPVESHKVQQTVEQETETAQPAKAKGRKKVFE